MKHICYFVQAGGKEREKSIFRRFDCPDHASRFFKFQEKLRRWEWMKFLELDMTKNKFRLIKVWDKRNNQVIKII